MERPIRTFLTAAAAVLCLATAAGRADTPEPPAPHPALRQLEARLTEILARDCPGATVRYERDNRYLVLEYRTRRYLVHGRASGGGFAQEPQEATGPEPDGLYLRADVASEGPWSVAFGGGQWKEPYWTTSIHVQRLSKDEHVWAYMSYGTRTSRDVMFSIGRAIGSLAPVPPDTSPTPKAVETADEARTVFAKAEEIWFNSVDPDKSVGRSSLVYLSRRSNPQWLRVFKETRFVPNHAPVRCAAEYMLQVRGQGKAYKMSYSLCGVISLGRQGHVGEVRPDFQKWLHHMVRLGEWRIRKQSYPRFEP